MDTGARGRVLTGHTRPVSSVAFATDGRLATGGPDAVRVWDLVTGDEVLTLRPPRSEYPPRLAFSRDGRRLIASGHMGAVLWDARTVTDTVRVERSAAVALRSARAGTLIREEVADHLAADPAVPAPAVRMAHDWLVHYRENAQRINATAWEIVRNPNRSEDDYRRALRVAEAACRLSPGQGAYLNTLGVAQYRLGRFAEAAETLARARPLNQDDPSDLAFLAMARHRLGQSEAARTDLAALREAMKQARWSKDAEAKAFLAAAEALIDPPAAKETPPP
jgi:hypothetical protein